MGHSRRSLFKSSTGLFSAWLASSPIRAEVEGKRGEGERQSIIKQELVFPYGVASGDPLLDRVVLWTQVSSVPDSDVPLFWQVALDPSFQDVISEGEGMARREDDHTFKIDAILPLPGTTYYYRFFALGVWSMIGRTRTASQDSDHVRLAVVSCSSIWSGYMNAYEMIARRNDLDLVIHCGDYVYDNPDPDELRHMPFAEVDRRDPTNLEEQRRRYRYYRQDPFLRRAHQQHPWSIIWDNHDIVHQTPRAEAIQAFHEWTPIRAPRPSDRNYIYRQLSLGSLADVILLDTRHIGRGSALSGGADRSILGDEQFVWLQDTLKSSKARWRILGNQVLLHPFKVFGRPLSQSLWDGFPADRDRVLKFLADESIDNIIVVTGDAHLSFACDLKSGSQAVGVEFLPTSVSRGNLDEQVVGFLQDIAAGGFKLGVQTFNPGIRYFESQRHGYGIVDLKPEAATLEFWYTPIEEQSLNEELGRSMRVASGAKRITEEKVSGVTAGRRQSLPAPAAPRYFQKAPELGGIGGQYFDMSERLNFESTLVGLKLRSGDRLDAITCVYAGGEELAYGGAGGSEQIIWLDQGERVRSLSIGINRYRGGTRVFYLRLLTDRGRVVEAGRRVRQILDINAPGGRHLIGFYGRYGEEIDRLGPIFAPDA